MKRTPTYNSCVDANFTPKAWNWFCTYHTVYAKFERKQHNDISLIPILVMREILLKVDQRPGKRFPNDKYFKK